MSKYIVQLKEGFNRDYLLPYCNKLGRGETIPDMVIVECDNPALLNELEGVLEVYEDTIEEPASSNFREANSWHFPVLNNSNKKGYQYNRTGKGVTVYVIDSGTRVTHEDFSHTDIETLHTVLEGKTYDDEGTTITSFSARNHGTFCASLVVGNKYGVAPDVKLVNCFSGFRASETLKILDKILGKHLENDTPSVVSMSFTSNANFYGTVAERLTDNGVVLIAAAGNDNRSTDVLKKYPAYNADVLSVGCTEESGKLATYSNYGSEVNIFAPGHLVDCAGINSDTHLYKGSGTSAACPIVAGCMALFLEGSDKPTTREEVTRIKNDFILACTDYEPLSSTKEQTEDGLDSSPKKMAFSLFENEPYLVQKTKEDDSKPEPDLIPKPDLAQDTKDNESKTKLVVGLVVLVVIGLALL